MAKSISLKPTPPPAPAQPVAPPSPSRQGPPLRPGRIYTGPIPKGTVLTPEEANAFIEVGWTPGQPITPQLQAAVQDAQKDIAAAKTTLVADPATPPVTLKVQDISKLPPAEQARYRQNINQAMQAAAVPKPAPAAPPVAPPAAPPSPQNLAPGDWSESTQPTPPVSPTAQKVAESKLIPVDWSAPDRPATRTEPDAHYVAPPQAPEASAPDSGGAVTVSKCVHCGWDQAQPDDPDPEDTDKLAFLDTRELGDGRPYMKTYELYAGRMRLTFRTLATRESDACHAQVAAEQKAGITYNAYEWMERVMRLRLFLQLSRFQTDKADHQLPDGLSKWHNPNCEAVWEFEPTETEPLKLIEQHILSNILLDESMARTVQQYCIRFNHLVKKLEDQAHNDSFWPVTVAQH